MAQSFIDKKLKKMGEAWGITFEELAKLAQTDPEGFDRQKRIIFQQEFPGVTGERLENFFQGNKKKATQNPDSIDSVVETTCASLEGIGRIQTEGVEYVRISKEEVGRNMENIKRNCAEIEKKGKEITDNARGVLVKQAAAESDRISQDKKH